MRKYIHIRKVFLRRLVSGFILLACLWLIYTQIGRTFLIPVARNQLEQLTGSTVQISEIDFHPTGFVRMYYLGIGPEERGVYDNKILKAKTVDVWFSPWSLITFRPKIKRISLEDFFFHAIYDDTTKQWNLDQLDFKLPLGEGKAIPIIRARHGVLKCSRFRNGILEKIVLVGINGTFSHARGKRDAYGFYVDTDERLGFGGSSLRGIWYAGDAGKIQLFNSRISMRNSPIFDNDWDISNITLDVDYDSKDVHGLELTCTVGDDTALTLKGKIGDYRNKAAYEVSIEGTNIHLTNTKQRNTLVYNDDILEILQKNLRSFLTQFEPDGYGNVNLTSTGYFTDMETSKWKGTIECWGASIMDKKFPYPITDLKGILHVNEKGSSFEMLTCRHDEVDLTISGYAYGGGKDLDVSVTIQSDNMKLDSDLYKALNEKQKQLWITFTPSGVVAIKNRTEKKPGQPKTNQLNVNLLGTNAIYLHFPYPLQNLTGQVQIDSKEILFTDVVSRYRNNNGDYDITLNGNITEVESDHPRFNMIIDANNVPIDTALMDALPADYRSFYKNFEVDARTNAQIKVFPNEVGKRLVEYIARVSVRDASIQYEQLPLPWTNVNVDAVLTPDLIRLEHLDARSGEGSLNLKGKIWPVNEFNTTLGLCVSLQAERIELTDDLLWALPKAEAGFVKSLQTAGQVNITADLNIDSKESDCHSYNIVVECLGNSLVYDKFPYPIENITGTIDIREGEIKLIDMVSQTVSKNEQSLPGVINLEGLIHTVNNKVEDARFNVKARNISFDDKTRNALPRSLKDYYSKLSPNGFVDVDIEDGMISREANDLLVELSVAAALKECGFGKNNALTGVNAIVAGQGQYSFKNGLREANLAISSNMFRLMQKKITDLTATVVYDPLQKKYLTEGFHANCYGGKVLGDFAIKKAVYKGWDYRLQMVFEDINLDGVLAEGKSPEERQDYAEGFIDGSVSVFGNPVYGERKGRLLAGISNVNFGRKTLPGQVAEAAKTKEQSRPGYRFDEVLIESYLDSDKIVFEEVFMSGSTVLRGTGEMNLKTNDVNLDFTAFGEKMTKEPSLLSSLAASLGPAVVKVEVRGKIDKPQIQTQTLSVFKGPMEFLGPEEKK